MSSPITRVVGLAGAHEVLKRLQRSSETSHPTVALARLMEETGVADADEATDLLLEANLLYRRPDGFAITRLGAKTALLLDAIHGADLQDVWRRLQDHDDSLRNFSLIRNHLTEAFLTNLNRRPGFRRLYICSPWISFGERQKALLTSAVLREENRGINPELLVITRPAKGTANTPPDGVAPLVALGATVFLNRSLHTKLYIREPDAAGGISFAILGSQNLTKSTYLELGIEIRSDAILIQNLITYFLEVTNFSEELTQR